MDKKYWENYYNKPKLAPKNCSLFAKFVMDNFVKKGDILCELGCGNGRDSLFFAKNKVKVISYDQCNNEQLKKDLEKKNGIFQKKDFTKLKDLKIKLGHIYSRFTLHSITKEEQDRTLDWAFRNLEQNGFLHIEVRGKKNELYKKGESVKDDPDAFIFENHYRRFNSLKNLKDDLNKRGFKITYSKEDKGFAPYKNTDFIFIRIVAQKK